MAFNFPSSPVAGQVFTDAATGVQYVFTNGAWMQTSASPALVLASPFKRTVLTTAGTTTNFQYDPTTLYADVEVVGGGGAGGYSTGPTSGAGLAVCGGGGGGGGYVKKLIQVTDAVRAATKTILVGAAGTGGTAGGGSSYGDTVNAMSANGGSPGGSSSAWGNNTQRIYGGLGGTTAGGDINIPGEHGETGTCHGATTESLAGFASGVGGMGGRSALGGQPGRGAAIGTISTPQSASGSAAGSAGCGGGGGIGLNSAANPNSSNGAAGIVIITEYR